MSIPDFQTLMLPVLTLMSDGQEHGVRDIIESISNHYHLTEAERTELLPSGRQPVIDNRTQWAISYMKHAGLVDRTRRSHYRITNRGVSVLAQNPRQLDVRYLLQFPEFKAFRQRERNGAAMTEIVDAPLPQTPEELLEAGYLRIRQELAQEILGRVKACTPGFFEQLVVELLVSMGYGGSRRDAGEAIGRSGDEGIDGIIKEDRLGLDTIFIQAKRWEGTVGRPEIQRFVGALLGQRARKGVFITTSEFSREAKEFANSIDSKVVLIDGDQLANLMIDHNVGVTTASVYEIKRMDSDYFSVD